ncbi:MAG TPA: phosphate-starvation-inducible PsiE family protein [Edaphobacter sp.]|nr:phosphate-starvation-inducible PsiE family protein [Edaphobacter sp.]
MTNKISTLTSEIGELRSKWKTLSIYERFQQAVVAVLTLVIAVIVTISTWQLLLHTLKLVRSHVLNPADSQVFQNLFGMVLTVLIALEFKHTLLVVKHHRRAVVQIRAVVLIALLALVRRFIILDLYQTPPSVIAALAGAALALGVVFWLVGRHEQPEEDEL